MKRLVLVVTLLLSLALAGCNTIGSNASSSPTVDRIAKSGVLRVGMSGNQPPLNMLDKTGATIGLEADIALGLATAMGVELTIVNKPFWELMGAVKSGDVDVVMSGLTMTPARNTQVAFAGPYFISGKAVLTKSKTLAAADEAQDINVSSITLAALKGSTSEEFVKQGAPDAKLVPVSDYGQAVQMVIDGQVDALVADYPITIISVMRHPEAGLEAMVSPFTFEPIGAAVSADDPLMANLVQNYISSLEGTGLLEVLRLKWLADGGWLDRLP
ncbi:MAG: transporter substrate-binding domain-containing protein [Deltaproteobacteria bacterium]|nr:transporter substrate-binding domain-containing protein [Deltaproteobacteria bacterium]MBW2419158.1 transporter substrate-binding domain-containing protein [Deltaproteobacteria bacterium]